jgi:hypothetical protein
VTISKHDKALMDEVMRCLRHIDSLMDQADSAAHAIKNPRMRKRARVMVECGTVDVSDEDIKEWESDLD